VVRRIILKNKDIRLRIDPCGILVRLFIGITHPPIVDTSTLIYNDIQIPLFIQYF
jgi:hypothetical protein